MRRALGIAGVVSLVGCGGGSTEASEGGSSSDSGAPTDESTGAVDPSTTESGGEVADDESSTGAGPSPGAACSADALLLVELVNEYRGQNGLPAIPASSSMCIVGQAHVDDLENNSPHAARECNLHSWSDAGEWSACCYTDDHAQAQCMWDKPSELTSYPGAGYENAVGGSGFPLTPEGALDAWKSSPGHNDVILNQGIWADRPWLALGAGLEHGYGVLWFGEEADPEDQ